MEDIKLLLGYIETAMKEGRKQVFGKGVVVDGDYVLDLVERIRVAYAKVNGEELVEKANEKANEILREAESRRDEILRKEAVVQEARIVADRIVSTAQAEKARKERELIDNLSAMLANAQASVDEANGKIVDAMNEASRSI
ncbi:MAG: hypothetical protein IJ676_06330, partial [Clostridia bacterium]|nr:hypothetical protein [Clostridia bacterium]